MAIKEKVLNVLKEVKPNRDFTGVDNIIDGGYLDSLELMGLISALNDCFNVEIDVFLIRPENFNSVDAISEMIAGLLE